MDSMYFFFLLSKAFSLQSVNFTNGLSIEEAESVMKAIAAVHSLTLGMKIKEKVDLNEKYPVIVNVISLSCD